MQSFICSRFFDAYLIASRSSSVGAMIKEQEYLELVRLADNDKAVVPKWLARMLKRLGSLDVSGERLSSVILVRRPSALGFGKASYEITEKCNYRCRHCYLGEKLAMELPLEGKKQVLKKIQEAGCLWLQITGGEPLASPDFVETYNFAYSLGFLITISTNGSLLGTQKLTDALSACPPYRLTVSLYGASAKSYETLTQVPGSFKKFNEGIEWAKELQIRTRLNIIVTKYNASERKAMIAIADRMGFARRVFSGLSPTLGGDKIPIEVMATGCDNMPVGGHDESSAMSCQAGKRFFHVDATGRMCICKLARSPSVDLLTRGEAAFADITTISEEVLKPLNVCSGCLIKGACPSCSPRLALYARSGTVPKNVCQSGLLLPQRR
ncbi:hypothetical protein A2482_00505 [Candidatus Falkowbacteria bacterium RIFOXYC2_FULL_48_21]|uniref:Radical SAM core domain-containing protein n=1 Tax=Candidatus Falkowbacteria bacterium RIFOXYC2_FULL_48_21 TaxID=1798005 RepID=A0A1F5TA69_9BACT|nr:MAG: hypothetical protein A2482_00505 [Candidatus Falkowbacteria bacterium RIFOXYC2_FULL_48_21]